MQKKKKRMRKKKGRDSDVKKRGTEQPTKQSNVNAFKHRAATYANS